MQRVPTASRRLLVFVVALVSLALPSAAPANTYDHHITGTVGTCGLERSRDSCRSMQSTIIHSFTPILSPVQLPPSTTPCKQKSTHISERISVELRTELYNVFNRVQFNQPGSFISDPGTFGQSTGEVRRPDETSVARQIQFGVRFKF